MVLDVNVATHHLSRTAGEGSDYKTVINPHFEGINIDT